MSICSLDIATQIFRNPDICMPDSGRAAGVWETCCHTFECGDFYHDLSPVFDKWNSFRAGKYEKTGAVLLDFLDEVNPELRTDPGNDTSLMIRCPSLDLLHVLGSCWESILLVLIMAFFLAGDRVSHCIPVVGLQVIAGLGVLCRDWGLLTDRFFARRGVQPSDMAYSMWMSLAVDPRTKDTELPTWARITSFFPNKFSWNVFDIGAARGVDALFHFHRGSRVVAVEANPTAARQLAETASLQTYSSRLLIMNVAVGHGKAKGLCVFPGYEAEQTYSPKLGEECRKPSIFTVVVARPCASLGVPDVAKIDVETDSMECLRSLLTRGEPAYISLEVVFGHRTGSADTGDVSQRHELVRVVRVLSRSGYRDFKLVGQSLFCSWYPAWNGGCGSGPCCEDATDALVGRKWRSRLGLLRDLPAYAAMADWFDLHARTGNKTNMRIRVGSSTGSR